MIYKRVIKFLVFFIIVDIVLSLLLVLRHFIRDTDYYTISDKFHFTRYFVFPFYKNELNQYEALEKLYKKFKFHHIFNFAAQAGVRYSFINPRSFIKNNKRRGL